MVNSPTQQLCQLSAPIYNFCMFIMTHAYILCTLITKAQLFSQTYVSNVEKETTVLTYR